MLAPHVCSFVKELIGDSFYSQGSYADAVRSYSSSYSNLSSTMEVSSPSPASTKWLRYKRCLARVLVHETTTTGGYNAGDLNDAVRDLEGIREGDVGEVHWVTIVALRRAVLMDYGDETYPYFECLGRDFQYTNPVCPSVPSLPPLTDEQVSWAELALHVLDKGLSLRPSAIGFLMKGQLLELLNKSGEKFLRKALAATGYGTASGGGGGGASDTGTLGADIMESLVYSLLNNSPRYALQTAKQYFAGLGSSPAQGGRGGSAHANFLVGLCWIRGGNPNRGITHLQKSLEIFGGIKAGFGTASIDGWVRTAAGKAACVTVQALLAVGEYEAAWGVLLKCEGEGWGGEAFLNTKMGVVLACMDRKDEALVRLHTAIGMGAGGEAEEGIEKLERLMRGYGDEQSDGEEDEEGY
ncbi:hypothetical protein TrRE_jg6217 [Triparma retinervis]|uniref:Uncharacterized protein n=1 Tax=Triparma retinervis TaxID=2557542 RepID=A0A9W7FVB5_9STRA|nr:hypothetical protein TrRE_jg6217 [Triparma retinervis]